MSFNTNDLVPNWSKASEILKGDVPGHAFHGNQWQATTAVGQSKALTTASRSVVNRSNRGENGSAMAFQHGTIASGHVQLARDILDAVQSGQIPPQRWGRAGDAYQAHLDAAEAHLGAKNSQYDAEPYSANQPEARSASDATSKAFNATVNDNLKTSLLAPFDEYR